MCDGTFFFESSFKCNSDRNISIFQWDVIGHVRERGCTSDSPQLLKRKKESRVIYKSQLQSAVHVTLCFVFHFVLILSFGFPPVYFMRKNRVRDKANFTKGDVALSRAKRFCFFWVCPKEIKKKGSWETWCFVTFVVLVLCRGLNFSNNAFYLFCVWCFRFCAKAWTNETTFHLASLFFGVWVASQFFKKTTVFFEPNKLGLFTSV